MIAPRLTCAVLLALAGCGTIPGAGPRTSAIEQGPYRLVDLTPESAAALGDAAAARRAEAPVVLPAAKPVGRMGPGDLLQVSIWEPNPAGTSLTADRSGLTTPTRVAADGSVSVPYVGRLRAAGETPAQLECDVAGRLSPASPGAQVAVLVTEDVTNNVIVQGDVGKPGRYPVVPGSSGLLDVLAMAGGAHTPDRQTVVRITRGDVSTTRTLSHLTATRELETDLSPGDRILVQPRLAYFYAFGEVNHPGEQAYDADDISLAHTLARIQGLSDDHADPAAVFVYRKPDATIYRLNLREPGGFFIAQAFPVLPEDLIYVSESPISEAAKVFQILTGISGVGAVPRNLGANY